MAGISSKALAFGNPENKYGFGDKELQSVEFSDGTGLEIYDFDARRYDPQIGRMLQVDPWVEKYERQSPFVAFNDNPIMFADPTGKGGELTIVDNGDGTFHLKVRSTIYVYNDKMSKSDREKYASKIQNDIMSQWNNPKDAGNGELGQIGQTGVAVVFEVSVVQVGENELPGLMDGPFDESKNFVKLVDGEGSHMDGGIMDKWIYTI
ncbi:MAG: RHS repeat-associated core domain-containing protein [Chitinophagaceae bacterium]